MPKKNYDEIKDVFSETEPNEFRLYGKNGVDYFTNVQKVDGGWKYDILRFASKAEYALFRQVNG